MRHQVFLVNRLHSGSDLLNLIEEQTHRIRDQVVNVLGLLLRLKKFQRLHSTCKFRRQVLLWIRRQRQELFLRLFHELIHSQLAVTCLAEGSEEHLPRADDSVYFLLRL